MSPFIRTCHTAAAFRREDKVLPQSSSLLETPRFWLPPRFELSHDSSCPTTTSVCRAPCNGLSQGLHPFSRVQLRLNTGQSGSAACLDAKLGELHSRTRKHENGTRPYLIVLLAGLYKKVPHHGQVVRSLIGASEFTYQFSCRFLLLISTAAANKS